MRRTTTLTAAALLGVALLGPMTDADAAGETCEGMPATIVGSPNTALSGTAGPDVIVTNGARSVDAGDGDDVVCVTLAADDPYATSATVAAGAGDDVVVVEEGASSSTDLGPGRDAFRGGAGWDRVEASLDDTIVADAGDDFVTYSIARGEQLPAVAGTATMTRTDGWIKVVALGRRLQIDGRDGVVRVDGRIVTTFPVAPRMLSGVAERVELLGTPGPDRLGTAGCATSVLKGRGGDDELVALTSSDAPGRECPRRRLTASGGRGDDEIAGTRFDDVLRGGPGRDEIVGRGGRDVADGGPGRDRCVAERKRRCER
jgi:Ca2+-binding RTX toxin-like protein